MVKPKEHPIETEVKALAKAGYDQANVDMAPWLADDVAQSADLLGVKGPDPVQWSDEARARRGADGGLEDPYAGLPRGD